MGDRALSRIEIIEVVRPWQAGESQRAVARNSGLALPRFAPERG